MELDKIIKQKSSSCDEYKKLWECANDIVKIQGGEEHLKQISSQMTEYDIHDERHSEKVIENMEKILSGKLEQLSFYELVLLYLAAYLHDSGMALPNWEYEALRAVEGCDKHSDSTLKFSIRNDFKPPQNFDEVKRIVESSNLFNYEQAKNYIFIEDSEEKVVENISNLIIDYESFRNQYEPKLKEKTATPDYIEFSKLIRSEFIRKRHHEKAAKNIENLNGKIKESIENAIGPAYTTKFLKDLANICQAHGEDSDFIKELPTADKLDRNGSKNNIQFLAEILRLGDIIHFSSDRAPLSLFSEKLITDETSLKHWKAKFGVGYSIFSDDKNQIQIAFDASFTEPQTYYFFVDYIKGIEAEIDDFNSLKQNWDVRYNIDFNPNVDTQDIIPKNFRPDANLKFTMDQSKILELLMGVQLYKDKFACLREVYQNALDTSKCLLAYNKKRGVSENIDIEFGVEEELLEGRPRKYIYCLDHGLGMNEDIIKKYLLHIGNSYYKSKDFYEKNAKWDFDVKPISQFGVGILSCYMIADKVGITTIYYEDKKQTSFVLSGISERFYYKQATRTDTDKIGNHGTIIKLYLKDEYVNSINSDFIPEMPLYLITQNEEDVAALNNDEMAITRVTGNLFYILFRYIAIQHSEVPVFVYTSNREKHSLYQYNELFDHNIPKNDIVRLLKHHFFTRINDEKKWVENIDSVENYIVKTSTPNITFYTVLSLPKKGAVEDVNLLYYSNLVGKKLECLCVDGIEIEKERNIHEFLKLYEDLLRFTLVNFSGEKKPVLSVDRTRCINLPKLSDDELQTLKDSFFSNIEDQIRQHFIKEHICPKDKEFLSIYKFVWFRYHPIAVKLLVDIVSILKDDVFFPDVELNTLKISSFISGQENEIINVNLQRYQEISRELILGKCIEADSIFIFDDNLQIKSSNYVDIPVVQHTVFSDKLSLSTLAIRADKWEGKYREYDLVSSLWPIINPKLFDKLICEMETKKISSHCKKVGSYGNSIQAISQLDPILINPNIGIGTKEKNMDVFSKDDLNIGQPDRIERKFFLFEMSNSFRKPNDKKSSTLFVYIAPRKLSNLEEARLHLKDKKQTEPDYFKGVKEGWSIYFLGAMQEYIIVPGIISRADMEKRIEKYKEITPDITYIDTNDKIVLEGRNLK